MFWVNRRVRLAILVKYKVTTDSVNPLGTQIVRFIYIILKIILYMNIFLYFKLFLI